MDASLACPVHGPFVSKITSRQGWKRKEMLAFRSGLQYWDPQNRYLRANRLHMMPFLDIV